MSTPIFLHALLYRYAPLSALLYLHPYKGKIPALPLSLISLCCVLNQSHPKGLIVQTLLLPCYQQL